MWDRPLNLSSGDSFGRSSVKCHYWKLSSVESRRRADEIQKWHETRLSLRWKIPNQYKNSTEAHWKIADWYDSGSSGYTHRYIHFCFINASHPFTVSFHPFLINIYCHQSNYCYFLFYLYFSSDYFESKYSFIL